MGDLVKEDRVLVKEQGYVKRGGGHYRAER